MSQAKNHKKIASKAKAHHPKRAQQSSENNQKEHDMYYVCSRAWSWRQKRYGDCSTGGSWSVVVSTPWAVIVSGSCWPLRAKWKNHTNKVIDGKIMQVKWGWHNYTNKIIWWQNHTTKIIGGKIIQTKFYGTHIQTKMHWWSFCGTNTKSEKYVK